MAALFPDTPASSSSNCSFSDDDSDYYSESKPDVPLLESKYTISPSKKCVKGSYSKQIVKNPRIGAKRPQTSVATTNEFAKPSSKKKRISISGKTSKHDDSVDPVWKWWEEDPLPNGVKWKTLEHEGPLFPPPYEPLPISVKFYYGGEHIILSPLTEEIAGFYSRMLDHDYTKSDIFNKNFFHDWRKYMTKEESSKITNLQDCDFSQLCQHFKLLVGNAKITFKAGEATNEN